MYVCVCHAVTDGKIREAVSDGLCGTMRELRMHLGVSSCCGKCAPHAHQVLRETLTIAAPQITLQAA